jgi:hypothetical protein
MVERGLRKDRKRLFQALEEFANIRQDKQGWEHFRRLWPDFFPEDEYKRAEEDVNPNIFHYPHWLDQIWRGGETAPYLDVLLGIQPGLEPKNEMTPEESWIVDLQSIPPVEFQANWDEGVFRYQGGCDFHRALYLLFRESWRARVCDKCNANFIARRAAQKYCSTDCSEAMQRDLKRKWWSQHGEAWRRKRKRLSSRRRGGEDGTKKTW